MSKIPLSFAELHAPLFLAGTNLGMKLGEHTPRHNGVTLVYDRAEKELLVTLTVPTKGEYTAIIPTTNVASMVEAKPKAETVIKPVAAAPVGKQTAQASSPQSHVHAGPGHGETGQTKKVVL